VKSLGRIADSAIGFVGAVVAVVVGGARVRVIVSSVGVGF